MVGISITTVPLMVSVVVNVPVQVSVTVGVGTSIITVPFKVSVVTSVPVHVEVTVGVGTSITMVPSTVSVVVSVPVHVDVTVGVGTSIINVAVSPGVAVIVSVVVTDPVHVVVVVTVGIGTSTSIVFVLPDTVAYGNVVTKVVVPVQVEVVTSTAIPSPPVSPSEGLDHPSDCAPPTVEAEPTHCLLSVNLETRLLALPYSTSTSMKGRKPNGIFSYSIKYPVDSQVPVKLNDVEDSGYIQALRSSVIPTCTLLQSTVPAGKVMPIVPDVYPVAQSPAN